MGSIFAFFDIQEFVASLQVADYVILGVAVLALVFGLVKGLLKQIFSMVGVFVYTIGTAKFSPTVQEWLGTQDWAVELFADESTRALVALIATFIIIVILYKIVTVIIKKAITDISLFGFADKILGGVLGVGCVYIVLATVVALVYNTSPTFLAGIKAMLQPILENSVIINLIFQENPYGEWIVAMLVEQLPFLGM